MILDISSISSILNKLKSKFERKIWNERLAKDKGGSKGRGGEKRGYETVRICGNGSRPLINKCEYGRSNVWETWLRER